MSAKNVNTDVSCRDEKRAEMTVYHNFYHLTQYSRAFDIIPSGLRDQIVTSNLNTRKFGARNTDFIRSLLCVCDHRLRYHS